MIERKTISALDYSIDGSRQDQVLPQSIDLGKFLLIGAGAIGNGFSYALSLLPKITGVVSLVDPEATEITNLNRYVLATVLDIARPKVERLSTVFGDGIVSRPFQSSYAGLGGKHGEGLIVTAVDNVKTRLDVEQDSPRLVLNAGMFEAEFAISRHDRGGNFLLHHMYPGYSTEHGERQKYPALPFVSLACGALLAGELVKERIDSLNRYRLNNSIIVNSMLSMPQSGGSWLVRTLRGE